MNMANILRSVPADNFLRNFAPMKPPTPPLIARAVIASQLVSTFFA